MEQLYSVVSINRWRDSRESYLEEAVAQRIVGIISEMYTRWLLLEAVDEHDTNLSVYAYFSTP